MGRIINRTIILKRAGSPDLRTTSSRFRNIQLEGIQDREISNRKLKRIIKKGNREISREDAITLLLTRAAEKDEKGKEFENTVKWLGKVRLSKKGRRNIELREILDQTFIEELEVDRIHPNKIDIAHSLGSGLFMASVVYVAVKIFNPDVKAFIAGVFGVLASMALLKYSDNKTPKETNQPINFPRIEEPAPEQEESIVESAPQPEDEDIDQRFRMLEFD